MMYILLGAAFAIMVVYFGAARPFAKDREEQLISWFLATKCAGTA